MKSLFLQVVLVSFIILSVSACGQSDGANDPEHNTKGHSHSEKGKNDDKNDPGHKH